MVQSLHLKTVVLCLLRERTVCCEQVPWYYLNNVTSIHFILLQILAFSSYAFILGAYE